MRIGDSTPFAWFMKNSQLLRSYAALLVGGNRRGRCSSIRDAAVKHVSRRSAPWENLTILPNESNSPRRACRYERCRRRGPRRLPSAWSSSAAAGTSSRRRRSTLSRGERCEHNGSSVLWGACALRPGRRSVNRRRQRLPRQVFLPHPQRRRSYRRGLPRSN